MIMGPMENFSFEPLPNPFGTFPLPVVEVQLPEGLWNNWPLSQRPGGEGDSREVFPTHRKGKNPQEGHCLGVPEWNIAWLL